MSKPLELPELEVPTASETSTSTDVPSLFSDEISALASIKVGLLESSLRALTLDEGFEGFCRELLLSLMRAIQCEAGSFFEVDHENQQLFFRASTGQSSDKLGHIVIPMGKGVVGYVAESRRGTLVADAAKDQHHIKTVQNMVAFETKNLIAVPVVIRGQIFGVLELLNRLVEPTFTEKDLEIANYFATICSTVIETRLNLAWALKRARSAAKTQRKAS